MAWPWERRRASSEEVLAAVAAYLRLLEAEWDSLTEVQRRSAIRLAVEAATALREPGARSPGISDTIVAPEQAEEPNA
jgi:hypothetical protein